MGLRKLIWIDVLTPKQALFTKSLLERAPPKVKCLVTVRDYSELNRLLEQLHLPSSRFGRHGGGKLASKLRASVERQEKLIDFVNEHDFDLSLSYLSPEAARVSFGLGLPHFVCSDSPHAVAPCRLAVPLACELFAPFVIPKSRWSQYGIPEARVKQYRALDPWCWLVSDRRRDLRRARKPGSKRRVLVRLEEWWASYMTHDKGISSTLRKLVELIEKVGDFEIFLVPRYDEQRSWARSEFGERCVVPDSTIDGTAEISSSDVLIGGGGTMTQEAALLGVPNISYLPWATLDVFENFYFPMGLSVKASAPVGLLRSVRAMLRNLDKESELFSSKARRVVANFEDPAAFIFKSLGSN